MTSQLQRLVLDFCTGELVSFLNEWAGGVWPPAPGSGLREVQRTLGCGLAGVQGAGEAAFERVA